MWIIFVPILAMATGLHMLLWPDVTLRLDNDYLENSTPEKARRSIRVSGAVLLAMGAIVIIAIVENNGAPVDAIGF